MWPSDRGAIDASGQGQKVIAVGDTKALEKVLSAARLGNEDLDSLTTAMKGFVLNPRANLRSQTISVFIFHTNPLFGQVY